MSISKDAWKIKSESTAINKYALDLNVCKVFSHYRSYLVHSRHAGPFVQKQSNTLFIATPDGPQQRSVLILQRLQTNHKMMKMGSI